MIGTADCGSSENNTEAEQEQTVAAETETVFVEVTGSTTKEETKDAEYQNPLQRKVQRRRDLASFTTSDKKDVPYRITLENLTVGSEPLDGSGR